MKLIKVPVGLLLAVAVSLVSGYLFFVSAAKKEGDDTESITKTRTRTDQEKIDAVLALAKSSLPCSNDNGSSNPGFETVLEHVMTIISDLEGNKQEVPSILTEMIADGTNKQCSTNWNSEKTAENLEQFENNNEPPNQQQHHPEDLFLNYADRHVRRVEEIVHDKDCMEREFDTSSPYFDPEEAAYVYAKCRLLVLRNVFPRELMESYRGRFNDYVHAIHTSQIDKSKTPTTDARSRDIVQYRGRKRHDIMLPKWLAGEEITGNMKVLDVLMHEKVLGRDMVLNQVGSVIAETGAPAMYWHEDQGYAYGDDSFEKSGIGGHDLPPYVVNMFVPLLDTVSRDHGPTEFCMGSSHMSGLLSGNIVPLLNKTLVRDGGSFLKMLFFSETKDACPPEHWRVPLVEMGDVVLFDYHLKHRGGPNTSPELRSLLYAIYARPWFRDLNFDDDYSEKEENEEKDKEENSEFDEWAKGLRYTMVEESTVKHNPQAGTDLSSVHNFAGISEEPATSGDVEFPFMNLNVEGASVYIDDELHLQNIQPMQMWRTRAKIGQKMIVKNDKTGKVIKSWTIAPDQFQTVLAV